MHLSHVFKIILNTCLLLFVLSLAKKHISYTSAKCFTSYNIKNCKIKVTEVTNNYYMHLLNSHFYITGEKSDFLMDFEIRAKRPSVTTLNKNCTLKAIKTPQWSEKCSQLPKKGHSGPKNTRRLHRITFLSLQTSKDNDFCPFQMSSSKIRT